VGHFPGIIGTPAAPMTCVHCGKPVPAGVEVHRRPLTFSEAQTVMRQISYSRFITGYSLREWTGGRDIFVLLKPDSGQLLGALLVHHLRGGWSEIAVVFILEEHRGKGHGRCLLQSSVRTLRWTSERLLLFFCEPAMDRLVRAVCSRFSRMKTISSAVNRVDGYS
jgi:GNAT superfamily N-acetyltransferase